MDKKHVTFEIEGMVFEYDEDKNRKNIMKHGISFRKAARVFNDRCRIEFYDEKNSIDEVRYNVIGRASVIKRKNNVLFVVYTERYKRDRNGVETDITRIISARLATNFERGIYYGKYGKY